MTKRLLVLTLVLLSGCGLLDHRGSRPTDDDTDTPEPRQAVLLADAQAGSTAGDPVKIEQATLKGDVLELQVSYGGGCGPHTFDLHGTNAWTRSLPPGTSIYLSHDAHGDACEALLHEALAFDLRALKRVWAMNGYSGPVRLYLHAGHDGDPVATLDYRL